MPKVVVLGATGNQGLPACKHLIKSGKGWEIIAVTRNTSSPAAKELEALGCTLAAADVFDSASLAELFKGVKDEYACFLVTNYWQKKIGYKGEIDWGIKVVEAVVADGRCNHFVYTSVPNPLTALGKVINGKKTPRAKHFESKHIVEQRIFEKIPKYTIVRPGAFLENWGLFADKGMAIKVTKKGITIPFIAPSGSTVPWVALDDIGGVVAGVLNDPEKYIALKECAAVTQVCTGEECAKAFSEHYNLPAKYSPAPLCILKYVAPEFYANGTYFQQNGPSALYSTVTVAESDKETREAHPACMDIAAWLKTNPLPKVDAAVAKVTGSPIIKKTPQA